MLLTADCDIDKRKFGEYLNYLGIVTAAEYLDKVWAAAEIVRIRSANENKAINMIHSVDRTRDPSVQKLQPAELLEWIRLDGPELITRSVGISGKRKAKELILALELFELAADDKNFTSGSLARLRKCWTRLGRKSSETKGSLRAALNSRQMRSDCVLVPPLPGESELAFVVLLRDIRQIREEEVFPSDLDLRIAGASAGMFRVGRFSDTIRHAIAQSFGSLYSRIGMTQEFEEGCDEAAELLAELLDEEQGR